MVAGGNVDHYYLHEELYSVAGMAASNGMLEEAVVYDTYGKARIDDWPAGDVDALGVGTRPECSCPRQFPPIAKKPPLS